MRIEDLNSQPILLFPKPKDEVRFFDKDHVWVNGRQYISLKRGGEMLKEKRITNADRIRSMTDEELMRFLLRVGTLANRPWCDDEPCNNRYCSECITEWLKEEVSE